MYAVGNRALEEAYISTYKQHVNSLQLLKMIYISPMTTLKLLFIHRM